MIIKAIKVGCGCCLGCIGYIFTALVTALCVLIAI